MAAGARSVRSLCELFGQSYAVAAARSMVIHHSLRQVRGANRRCLQCGAALRAQAATSPLPLRLRPGRSKLLGEQYVMLLLLYTLSPVHIHQMAESQDPTRSVTGTVRVDVAGLRWQLYIRSFHIVRRLFDPIDTLLQHCR
jgi:hypothetical protein